MPGTKPTRPLTDQIPESLPASDVVVLGYVAGEKNGISGKEIDEKMDLQGTRSWTEIGSSSVYNCLKRLEQYGFVRSKPSKKEGHGLRPYTLTTEGLKRLEVELMRRLESPKRSNNELDIAIASLPLLIREKVLKALERHMEKLDRNLQFLESSIFPLKQYGSLLEKNPEERVGNTTIGRIDPREVELILALFDRQYRELRARKQWLREFVEKVRDGYVWCADYEPNVQNVKRAVVDESQRNLESKRKEQGKRGILI